MDLQKKVSTYRGKRGKEGHKLINDSSMKTERGALNIFWM